MLRLKLPIMLLQNLLKPFAMIEALKSESFEILDSLTADKLRQHRRQRKTVVQASKLWAAEHEVGDTVDDDCCAVLRLSVVLVMSET